MSKVAFIIPGFLDSTKSKEYQLIGNMFQEEGIKPMYVDVDWKYSTISKNTEDFLKLFRTTRARRKYILGFSFGAIIAYLVAGQEKVDVVFLCSLSPYFAEDLPYIKESWKKDIGKKRIEDFRGIRNKEIAPKIQSVTYFFFGANEHPSVERRVNDTYDTLRSKKYLIKVVGAKHDLANESYLQEVRRAISNL